MKRWDGVWKILSPFTKRLGPDGKMHEGWCPIFERHGCNCDMRGGRRRRIIRKGDGGATFKQQATKLEDA